MTDPHSWTESFKTVVRSHIWEPVVHWCLGLPVPTQTWAGTPGCGWQLRWWSRTPECQTGTWQRSQPAGPPLPAGGEKRDRDEEVIEYKTHCDFPPLRWVTGQGTVTTHLDDSDQDALKLQTMSRFSVLQISCLICNWPLYFFWL